MKSAERDFDGIIFDVDGTLWDVRDSVAKVWRDTITEAAGWPITFDAHSLGEMFGKTMDTIFFHFYPDSTQEEYEKISSIIYGRQQEYLIRLAPPLYEGVEKTLARLAEKYRLFIVTNAQRGYIETVFAVHDIRKYFTDWMCFGDTDAPKDVTIRKLMERNHLKNAVYVGDTKGDWEACKKAGIPMVYAGYGLGRVDEPWKEIKAFPELEDIFAGAGEKPPEIRGKRNTVIFDLDGTLLDTLDDLRDSVNHVLAGQGMQERSLKEIRTFVGNGVGKLMERAVEPGTSKELEARMLEEFRRYYTEHSLDKTKPYDGVRELLEGLKEKGCKLAVVSNKLDGAVKGLCDHFFKGLLDIAMGEHGGIEKKPSPDMVNQVLCKLGVSRGDAVYVGDSEVDIATAGNAGMPLIMVEWGFRDREEMKRLGAEHFAKEAGDILSILDTI